MYRLVDYDGKLCVEEILQIKETKPAIRKLWFTGSYVDSAPDLELPIKLVKKFVGDEGPDYQDKSGEIKIIMPHGIYTLCQHMFMADVPKPSPEAVFKNGKWFLGEWPVDIQYNWKEIV